MEIVNWEVVSGCENLGGGCESCPSLWEARENEGVPGHKFEHGYGIRLYPERLTIPLREESPTVYSVAFGSDLFHKDVPMDFIKQVFRVMNKTPHHFYEIVTKRVVRPCLAGGALQKLFGGPLDWTDNIMLTATVEDASLKWRIRYLKDAPAKRKAISICPILGDVGELDLDGIDVVGAVPETWGLKRPFKEEWIDNVKRQCLEQGVPFVSDHYLYQPEEAR